VDGLHRVRRRIRTGELTNQSHRMRKEDGATSGPIGESLGQQRGRLGQDRVSERDSSPS
jgi:hypothetical protein